MLRIVVPRREWWDEEREEFIFVQETALQLEHSLISLSRWESKWQKAFLSDVEKTEEETLDYVRCMCLNPRVDPMVFRSLTSENLKDINEYISSPMTATVINYRRSAKPNKQKVTSELVYYWMIAFGIPFECEKWHLNRLLKLIEVCEVKNQPSKKRSQKEIMCENAALNKARRSQLKTSG